MEFNNIAIVLCSLLLIFLLFKEISRNNKSRLIWRILASIIAVTCFALLVIPVKYQTKIQQNTGEIILLTEGTNPDSVAKIKGTKYSLPSADLKNIKTTVLPDLSYFLNTHKAIRKITIYGYGLTDEELKGLNGYEISFHPSLNPTGVSAANWPQKLKHSGGLSIQGNYQNNSDKTVKLLLKGLGNVVDSTFIEAQSNKKFSFKSKPKQSGRAVYELISFNGNDTLAKEPVPFIVEEQAPMKVLILASFPDFEYKFLKKWLFDNQYALAFRSQISKNKYSTDFLNMDSISINRISTSSLRKFDVLIIDEEELAALGQDEKTAINNAVNNGMGLFIRISNPKPLAVPGGNFARFENPATKDKHLSLFSKDGGYKFSQLPAEQTLYLKPSKNELPVIIDGNGKTLVNSNLKGSGKVLISSIASTFNWQLSGKTADYTNYWSEILSKAARKKIETQFVKTSPQFPLINQQIHFVTDLASAGKIPSLKAEGVKLAPKQNLELPFEWDAVFWPVNSGWNNLSVNQSDVSFFVYKNNDWLTLKNQQKINSTRQYSIISKNQEAKSSSNNIFIQEEVSIWWFFTGFLFAIAFLWYESRILDTK
ncbi:hypothetical protein [Pedobacter aquatilis]|uniref:hypothetical protein n=1 Tax=Pedobacter aquatilis TaxID=351343 RepID=UPI00292D55EA|nr:hypothetical protein [Pedobacter aquatilis]